MVTLFMIDRYLVQVTYPNLLVHTSVSVSFVLGGKKVWLCSIGDERLVWDGLGCKQGLLFIGGEMGSRDKDQSKKALITKMNECIKKLQNSSGEGSRIRERVGWA